MSKADEVLSDLGVVKANLAETQGDLAEVLALNTKQSGQIADLGASVDALKVELAGKVEDLSKLDAIAAQVAEIKATSREIADVVPEPSTEQPPTEEQPPAPPVDTPPPTE